MLDLKEEPLGVERSPAEIRRRLHVTKLCPCGSWPYSASAGHLPLALTGMQDKFRVVPGADCQLMLCGVEDVKEQVALPGAVQKDKGKFRKLQQQREATLPFPSL